MQLPPDERGEHGDVLRGVEQADEPHQPVEERRVERAYEERAPVMVVEWRRSTRLDDERSELARIHAQREAEIRFLGRRLSDVRYHGQVERDGEVSGRIVRVRL